MSCHGGRGEYGTQGGGICSAGAGLASGGGYQGGGGDYGTHDGGIRGAVAGLASGGGDHHGGGGYCTHAVGVGSVVSGLVSGGGQQGDGGYVGSSSIQPRSCRMSELRLPLELRIDQSETLRCS
ncbi:hypothetical protein CASFOL_036665 [Castilleja foliolosa]|uniref:Uncharacterized protein n=1 Tax=Castilleja foliolosa TaxID=1961234 RepID=A0ABD3BNQ0_9LAMI